MRKQVIVPVALSAAGALASGKGPDLVRNLREVLTLAQIQPGVVLPAGAMRMMSSSTRTSIPVSSPGKVWRAPSGSFTVLFRQRSGPLQT